MKRTFNVGDKKEFTHIVKPVDVAAFHGVLVHSVYATFALARDVEWTSRLFVLEMLDVDEEGIGTHLSILHKSPAFIGDEIIFTAQIEQFMENELTCSFEAKVLDKIIAVGKTGQKILKKETIQKLFKTM